MFLIPSLRSFPAQIQAVLQRKAVCFSFVRLSSLTGSFAKGQKVPSHSCRTPDLSPGAAQCCPSRDVITAIISLLGAEHLWKLLRTGRAKAGNFSLPSLVATSALKPISGIWLRWQSWSSLKESEKKSGNKTGFFC